MQLYVVAILFACCTGIAAIADLRLPIRRCPNGWYLTVSTCGWIRKCPPGDRCVYGKCCSPVTNCCPTGYTFTKYTCTNRRCPARTRCINNRCCAYKSIYKPCPDGEFCVDLDKNGRTTGRMAGLATRIRVGRLQPGKACSRQGVFRVEFQKLSNNPNMLCYNGKYSGQRMLRIQMVFSSGSRGGHIFDLGDSQSNNGWAGDAGHSDYAAELHGVNKDILLYANAESQPHGCNAQLLKQFTQSLSPTVSKVTVWIANHFIKVTNSKGENWEDCNKCLFGLNGQQDGRAKGTADQYIWIALNRVVYGYRTGHGLCNIKMKWVADTTPP